MPAKKRRKKKQRKSSAEPHSDLTQASSSRHVEPAECSEIPRTLRHARPISHSSYEPVDLDLRLELPAIKSVLPVREGLEKQVLAPEVLRKKAPIPAQGLRAQLQTAVEDLERERSEHQEFIRKHEKKMKKHMAKTAQAEGDAETWKEEVETLRLYAENEHKARIQETLHLKQDRLLESLQSREAVDKAVAAEKRWQKCHHKAVEMLEDEQRKRRESSIKHEMDLEKFVLRTVHAERETKIWREEVEHLTIAHRTLDEDLEELKTISNEQAAQARESSTRRQLPPAYGSLDDEAQQPPYEVHAKDSKSFQVNVFRFSTSSL